MFQNIRPRALMRVTYRAGWWVGVLCLLLLPVAALMLPSLGWYGVLTTDLLILAAAAVVLGCSSQARAGLRMIPHAGLSFRSRRGRGLTAAHLSL